MYERGLARASVMPWARARCWMPTSTARPEESQNDTWDRSKMSSFVLWRKAFSSWRRTAVLVKMSISPDRWTMVAADAPVPANGALASGFRGEFRAS